MQYTQHAGLPDPDEASAAHSRRVVDFMAGKIREAGGSISFAEFMQHALYAPGLGYYSAGATKFGAAGDFVTAPEISPVFGRILARQCAEVLRQVDGGSILEFGAGSGKLALDLLQALEELDALPDRYRILEVSADLQGRQEQMLASSTPHLVDRVEWLADMPRSHSGVVIANEVLDAMPVERFERTRDGVLQCRVGGDAQGFRLETQAAPDRLADAVARIEEDIGRELPPGYVSETSLGVSTWVSDLAGALETACVFLFDYGGSRREMFAEDRSDGWLRCHFRHHAHNDPLVLAGIQDITAWVDFTAVAVAAVDNEVRIAGYLPQSMFLAGGGLDEELRTFGQLSVDQQLALSVQIKTLTLPGEMGEYIKCMGLLKGPVSAPSAFRLGDRTHTL
jgi:SAM-dependent MidA family methyltransferase